MLPKHFLIKYTISATKMRTMAVKMMALTQNGSPIDIFVVDWAGKRINDSIVQSNVSKLTHSLRQKFPLGCTTYIEARRILIKIFMLYNWGDVSRLFAFAV